MPMNEDCCHYESRSYDDGEAARFCTLDLAPEAPWRCPDGCPKYERIQLLAGDLERGSLGRTPPVEPEPEGEDIAALLDEAEDIVNAAAPEVLADLDRQQGKVPWWKRLGRKGRGPDDGGEFRLRNR